MDLNEHHNMITSLKNLQNISRDDSRTGNDSCIDNAYKTRNKATRVEQHMGLYQHRKISATIHTCRNFFFRFTHQIVSIWSTLVTQEYILHSKN